MRVYVGAPDKSQEIPATYPVQLQSTGTTHQIRLAGRCPHSAKEKQMTPTQDAALDMLRQRFDSVKTRLTVYASPSHRRFKESDETVRLYRAAKDALDAVLASGTNDDLVAADRAITALDDHVENKVGLNPTERSNRTGTEQQPTPAVDRSTMSTDELLRLALMSHLDHNAKPQGGARGTSPTLSRRIVNFMNGK